MTINLPIQPHRPVRGGLESIVLPLPDEVRDERQWRQGLRLTTDDIADDDSFLWPVACGSDPELDEKPEGPADLASYDFHPFVVGGAAKCGPNDRTPIGDIARIKARRALERNRYRQLATVLFTGDDGTGPAGNTGFLNEDAGTTLQTPAGFDVTNPNGIRETIAGLLDAYCGCADGGHAFYAPQSYLPYFDAALPNLKFDPASGLWMYGDIPFVFDCFPNEGNATLEATQATAADGTEAWVYLAPRPWVGFSEVVNIEARAVLENKRLVVAEQPAILAYDPTCVHAAKALVA